MYTMVATRPDISHAVGVVSRFMHDPGQSHWNTIKHMFRYLAATKDHDILFGPNSTLGVVGYTDSDFADCVDKYLVEVETSGVHSHLNDRSRICSCV